ncbi:hypothetical protein LSH36_1496g00035 [Paralvinella palmiformis]|uniref:Uncharacterized protein n=1 Tax=Paralvinella palmiformis TaxID=53620 RepID=A0AAD9MQJ1_9ANNE|nr:hypothetical protein LSH36_1496g00035 [Paralvinella palmiformis]
MVYSKLEDGDQCCGERAYFMWTATCCNGHIYHTHGLKCCCNGTVPYHPANQHCIEGKTNPKFCKVMRCPHHVRSKELLKDHFMKEQWLVVGARSVVQSTKNSQLVEIIGEATSTEPKRIIKMVILQECYRKHHKHSVFFLSKAPSRKNNSIIVITDRDMAMKRKSLDKLVLHCTRTVFKNEHHKSIKRCQRVIKLCGNSGNQPGLSSSIVNPTLSGEILVSGFILQMISVFHIF